VAYDLWYLTLKGTDNLYIVESFELKTIEEYVAPEYRVLNEHQHSAADKSDS